MTPAISAPMERITEIAEAIGQPNLVPRVGLCRSRLALRQAQHQRALALAPHS